MLPEGWKAYSLIELTKWSSGGTPSKSNDDFWGGDIPWISASSMRSIYYSDSELMITEKAVLDSAKMADKDNILLLVRGSMLWNKIPVGVTTREVSFNQDVKCIKPEKSKIEIWFLLYWFLAKERYLLGMVTGTGIGAGKLDTNELQSLDVFLPPLPEQKKIAQILSIWDSAISATERLLENSQQRKKALMQQLLTGKKRLPGFEGEWKHVKLGDVVSKTQLGTTERGTQKIVSSNPIPLIKMGNLGWNSINFKKVEMIDQSYIDESLLLERGDFLFNTRNTPDLVGKSAVWLENYPATFDNNINRISFKSCIDSYYISYYLNSGRGKSLIQSLPAGSTSVAAIYWKDLRNIKLVVPPLPEQKKIAVMLTTADQEIEALQKSIGHLKQEKKALMQQLLTGKRRVQVDVAA